MRYSVVLLILSVARAVSAADPNLPQLSIILSTPEEVALKWPKAANNFVLESSDDLGPSAFWTQVEAVSTGPDQLSIAFRPDARARFYRLRQSAPAFQVTHFTPGNGATEVGVTVRPQVFFSEPVKASTLSAQNFYAQFAGLTIPATIVPANDGSFAWLFFKQPMPGGARVQVIVDGSSITSAASGTLLDADGDGTAGGLLRFEFTTVSVQAVAGTSLSGIVVDPGPDLIPRTDDDVRPGPDGQVGTGDDVFLLPIEGVQVHLLGREDNVITTQADGRFHFDSVPVGDVKVVVNGRTAAHPPTGMYFPEMVIDAQMVSGQDNHTMTNGPEVYLPRLSTAILQTIQNTQSNLVQATPAGAPNLSAFQRSQLSIAIGANSLIGADGQALANAQVGISTVPSDLVRDMLPPGVLQHTFDITVQAPGVATFATPASMTFPNVFNAAPGSKLNFLSFDHTTGRLVIEGTATVSDDGSAVRTDPGTGVTHPGWHGLTPPGGPNDLPDPPDPDCQYALISADEENTTGTSSVFRAAAVKPPTDIAPAETDGIKDYFFASDDGDFTLTFKNTAPKPAKNAKICGPNGTGALVVRIQLFGNESTKTKANRFLEGLDKFTLRPFLVRPGEVKRIKVTLTKLLNGIKKVEQDRLYGAQLVILGWEQGKPEDLLIEREMYVGRYLDATDANHTDGIMSLADTATGWGTNPGVVRKRTVEQRGTPMVLQASPAADSPFTVTETEVQFAPKLRGPRASLNISVVSPNGRTIGSLTAEAEARLQEFSVNGDRIRAVLQRAAKGEISGVTDAQRAFLNDEGAIDRIVDATLKKVDEIIFPFLQGINRTPTDPSVGVTIGAYSTDETAKPAEVDPLTLGTSDVIDICSLDGNTCLQRDVPVAPHPLIELIKSVPNWSKSETAFRLSKALNHRPEGKFDMYIDHFLTGKHSDGTPYVLTEEKLEIELAATIVHEVGHTLGLIHTYNSSVSRATKTCGCALGPNGKPITDFRADVMSHGEVLGGVVTTVSGPGFYVSLGLDYVPDEAMNVIKYFAANLRGAKQAKRTNFLQVFDGSGDGEDQYPMTGSEPGTLLLFLDGDDPVITSGQDFGRVLADGAGGNLSERVFLLNNLGDQPVTIGSATLSGNAESFSLPNLISGAVIQPGDTLLLPVRFDPSESGAASATLTVTHDGAGGAIKAELSGFGYRNTADIRVLVDNNNVGGARLGAVQPIVHEFGVITNIGGADLLISEIRASDETFAVTGLPAFSRTNPLRIKPGATAAFDLRFAPQRLGLQRARIQFFAGDPTNAITTITVVGTGLPPSGSSLDYGHDFAAMESPDFPNAPVLRAKTDADGNFQFFLPPDQRYHYVIFDPVSGLVAHGLGITAPSGVSTPLGVPVFLPSIAPDSDGDGLPDDVEFAIGTDPNKVDTDGDGVDDYAALFGGGDPLGGKLVTIGPVGQVAAGGDVRQVAIGSLVSAPAQLLAAVAAGTNGLALVDVTQASTPVLLGQFGLSGTAVDVGVDWSLGIAVVAGSEGGLHFLDIANPAAPALLRTIPGTFDFVRVGAGRAYALSISRVISFDLPTARTLATLDLPSGGGFQGIAREGQRLYIITGHNTGLSIVDTSSNLLTLRTNFITAASKVDSLFFSDIAVVNGIGYVALTRGSQTAGGGYATYDLNDNSPQIVGGPTPPFRVPGFGLNIAVNGSGFGLLLGSAGSTNVADLVDTSNLTNTYAFRTRINLPGPPSHAVIAGGLAYIACGPAGLVILNYMPFDTAGQPPVVSIATSAADVDPITVGTQVMEGSPVPVQAKTSDDTQVALVEILLNGVVAGKAITPPFTFPLNAPSISQSGNTFTLQARATDTGGNVGLSDKLVFGLVRDSTPFTMIRLTPGEGEVVPAPLAVIRAEFSKTIQPPTGANPLITIRDENGFTITPKATSLEQDGKVLQLILPVLAEGRYTLTVNSLLVRDYSGSALGTAPIVSHFFARKFTITWNRIEDGVWKSGHWFVATNWAPARVPGPDDSVYIDAPGAAVLIDDPNFAPGQQTNREVLVRDLVSKQEIDLLFVNLNVAETFEVDNQVDIEASMVRNTHWTALPNTHITYHQASTHTGPGNLNAAGYSSAFENVQFDGVFQARIAPNFLGHITVNGELVGENFGSIDIWDDTVIDGTGTISNWSVNVASGQAFLLSAPDIKRMNALHLTIGEGLIFKGAVSYFMNGPTVPVIVTNRGRIVADVPLNSNDSYNTFIKFFTPLNTYTNLLVNEGLIEVSGASLRIDGIPGLLQNSGTIRCRNQGLLQLGSDITTPRISCEPGSIVQFSGGRVLTPNGQVTELAGGGSWFAGTQRRGIEDVGFTGGTVRMLDGAYLEGSPIFNNVTFEGDVHSYDLNLRKNGFPNLAIFKQVDYGITVGVISNLTLHGTMTFHPSTNLPGQLFFYPEILHFDDPHEHRIDGPGQIIFEGLTYINLNRGFQPPVSFTGNQIDHATSGRFVFGPEMTVRGDDLMIGNIQGSFNFEHRNLGFRNEGVLEVGPSQRMQILTQGFTNAGTIHLSTNATLDVVVSDTARTFSQTAEGKIVFDAAGTSVGNGYTQFPLYVVSTRANQLGAALDGTLVLNFLPTYVPKNGDTFELLRYPNGTNAFKSIESTPALSGGFNLRPEYGSTNFLVTVGTNIVSLPVTNPPLADPCASPNHPPTVVETHGGLHFDGTFSRAQVTNSAAILNPFPFTVATWFRTTKTNDFPMLVSCYLGWGIELYEGKLDAFYVPDNFDYPDDIPGTVQPFVADGQWHFAAYTVDENGARLYVDGNLAVQQQWKGKPGRITGSELVWFGYYPNDNGDSYRGDLDEISVWGRALSATEVSGIMHKRLTGGEDCLVGLWHFDEKTGTTALDATGNGHNAGLQATTWIDSSVP